MFWKQWPCCQSLRIFWPSVQSSLQIHKWKSRSTAKKTRSEDATRPITTSAPLLWGRLWNSPFFAKLLSCDHGRRQILAQVFLGEWANLIFTFSSWGADVGRNLMEQMRCSTVHGLLTFLEMQILSLYAIVMDAGSSAMLVVDEASRKQWASIFRKTSRKFPQTCSVTMAGSAMLLGQSAHHSFSNSAFKSTYANGNFVRNSNNVSPGSGRLAFRLVSLLKSTGGFGAGLGSPSSKSALRNGKFCALGSSSACLSQVSPLLTLSIAALVYRSGAGRPGTRSLAGPPRNSRGSSLLEILFQVAKILAGVQGVGFLTTTAEHWITASSGGRVRFLVKTGVLLPKIVAFGDLSPRNLR